MIHGALKVVNRVMLFQTTVKNLKTTNSVVVHAIQNVQNDLLPCIIHSVNTFQ